MAMEMGPARRKLPERGEDDAGHFYRFRKFYAIFFIIYLLWYHSFLWALVVVWMLRVL